MQGKSHFFIGHREAPEDIAADLASAVRYPPGIESLPRCFAIIRANRYMLNHTDYLIAYAWHPARNTWELVEYAEARTNRGLMQVRRI